MRPLVIASATFLAALALAAPGAAQGGDGPFRQDSRPSSEAIFRENGQVVVRRLEASVVRRNGRLVADVRFAAASRTGTRRVVVRLGRCTSGPVGRPACPPTVNRTVTLRGRAITRVRFTARLRQPSSRLDAIDVVVTRPGERPRPQLPTPFASLYLRGTAWRGEEAGGVFGLRATPPPGVVLRGVRMDGPAVLRDALRPSLAWTLTSSVALSLVTTLAPCDDDDCPTRAYPTDVAAGATRGFRERPVLRRDGGTAWTYELRTQGTGTTIFAGRLPWPLAPR